MWQEIILRLLEFLVIRYEGIVWADIRLAIANHRQREKLAKDEGVLSAAIKTNDIKKIDAAGADVLNNK